MENRFNDDAIAYPADSGQKPDHIFQNRPLMSPTQFTLEMNPAIMGGDLDGLLRHGGQNPDGFVRRGAEVAIG